LRLPDRSPPRGGTPPPAPARPGASLAACYFEAGAGAGAGDDADGGGAGAAAGGLAGAVAGMMVDSRRWAGITSVTEVSMKTMAPAGVSLPGTVGVPIEPKTAWLPDPPNAEPMSAPLPACSRTREMMIRLTTMWMITMRMYMPRLLLMKPRPWRRTSSRW